MKKNVTVSANFRKQALKAIFSIVVFVFTYLLLFALAISVTILCGYAGIMIIVFKPMLITLGLGLGLISMGILTLIFLVKFIFKKHSIDRSHLTEISREEHPGLFDLIKGIVKEVKTDFPKKIYLSSEVNASVFYDSSFRSMFLPVKKNLQIGMGLINTVTLLELKAILAHEFGHFSQRSMKVGSYVYNVNQVIYNLLYDNGSFQDLASRWASTSGYFTIFVMGAFRMVQGIQWVLRKNYDYINLNYMALSREMEFHADEVAAHVAGSRPLASSLRRLELADYAFNEVIRYYEHRIGDAIVTENLYPQQHEVMLIQAQNTRVPVIQGFPQVSGEEQSRFNRSKLVINNQWASHPTTPERVAALMHLGIEREEETYTPASSVLLHPEEVQAQITHKLFTNVSYEKPAETEPASLFLDYYRRELEANTFPPLFNNYYDHKNPGVFRLAEVDGPAPDDYTSAADLFSNEAVDWVYQSISLENDRQVLLQIANGTYVVKSFDYDGQRYEKDDSKPLADQLEKKRVELETQLAVHDRIVYRYFLALAKAQQEELTFQAHYQAYLEDDLKYQENNRQYEGLRESAAFMSQRLPFSQIEQQMILLKGVEPSWKECLSQLFEEAAGQPYLSKELNEDLTKYLSKDWTYFEDQAYENEAIQLFYRNIQHFGFLLSKRYFNAKRQLLDGFVRLEEKANPASRVA